jgi:predicted phosphodiesterase
MRALVISDIHGNIDALRALERQSNGGLGEFDRIVCLGDLVDYGPDPGAVIGWVQAHATDVVGGNHDHAMATGEPCESAPAYLEASVATRDRLRSTLTRDDIAYLAGLPLTGTLHEGGRIWHLVHATPANPLQGYAPPDWPEERWVSAMAGLAGRQVLVGHTHLAFARPLGGGVIINPGSIGMPKDGNPNGSYAVVRDGAVQFHRVVYDPGPMIRRLKSLDLRAPVFDLLARTFRTGA